MERPQGYPTTSAGPCITLLQERFKQLKRQREEREEKQFLETHSGNNNKRVLSPAGFKKQNSEANGFSLLKDDLIFGAKTTSDDPLSLGLNNLSSKNMEYRDIRKNKILWQADKSGMKSSDYKRMGGGVRKFQIRDVDTSLHL